MAALVAIEDGRHCLFERPIHTGEHEIDLQSFGRRLVVSAKQNLNQRIKEVEKEIIYNEYSNSVGEIIVGEIESWRVQKLILQPTPTKTSSTR